MEFNVYWALIAASIIVLLSYFYNALAGKTNIPSVLMLIVTGFAISQFIEFHEENLRPVLEVLGTVGLVMIVLEAAVDLKLEKSKTSMLVKSLVIALLLLLLTTFGIAMIIRFFYVVEQLEAIIYAIPLSIMSSAIIIPSVAKLVHEKKEFLIMESAFSDILGIMLFYFILDTVNLDGFGNISLHIIQNLGLTLIIAVAFGYLIIILIQKVTGEVKLFLPIAVLVLLYATGKLFHLSSLIFVLVFGLMLNNITLFFRGFLTTYIIPVAYKELLSEIKLITLESSFLIRTFFFIVFGMSITLDGFNQISVFVVSFLALAIMYILRWGAFKLIAPKQILPGIYVAARGLITILLFYSIPAEHQITGFSPAVLFLIIITSNLIMMYGLIRNGKEADQADEIVTESEIEEILEHPFDLEEGK
jgi:Kef-type K+ transport system membrane component KefB